MELEAIHERAIELLVSGKRQYVVAKELGIGVRTLRRWASDEKFMAELRSQRECANKLAAEQLAAEFMLEQQVAERGAKRLCELMDDPKTPPAVLTQCLRISQNILIQRERRGEAQEWREFLYFDKIARAEEKEAALKKELDALEAQRRADLAKFRRECQEKDASDRARQSAATTPPPSPSHPIKVDIAAATDKLLADVAAKMKVPEIRPNAAKTGQSRCATGPAAVVGGTINTAAEAMASKP
jgi:hypothetical protein